MPDPNQQPDFSMSYDGEKVTCLYTLTAHLDILLTAIIGHDLMITIAEKGGADPNLIPPLRAHRALLRRAYARACVWSVGSGQSCPPPIPVYAQAVLPPDVFAHMYGNETTDLEQMFKALERDLADAPDPDPDPAPAPDDGPLPEPPSENDADRWDLTTLGPPPGQ